MGHPFPARAVAFAWAADEVRLGAVASTHAQLLRWARDGTFRPREYEPPAARFVASAWRLLRRYGYLR